MELEPSPGGCPMGMPPRILEKVEWDEEEYQQESWGNCKRRGQQRENREKGIGKDAEDVPDKWFN